MRSLSREKYKVKQYKPAVLLLNMRSFLLQAPLDLIIYY